jgi:Fe-S cluster assembly ATP-binding protein
MLKINDLHAEIGGTPILKGLSLEIGAGEIHAVMGPNGAGKSTLAYVLGGRDGYEVTGGSVTYNGEDLLDMAPHERAAAGLFLGFQYPVEIPGVSNVHFLRSALNSQRKARGEAELSGAEFLKLAREQASALKMDAEMITHYQRLLDVVKPDFVHVLAAGRIVKTGGPELAMQLENEGYEAIAEAA